MCSLLLPFISPALPWIIQEENSVMHNLKLDNMEKKLTKERREFQVRISLLIVIGWDLIALLTLSIILCRFLNNLLSHSGSVNKYVV